MEASERKLPRLKAFPVEVQGKDTPEKISCNLYGQIRMATLSP